MCIRASCQERTLWFKKIERYKYQSFEHGLKEAEQNWTEANTKEDSQ